MVRCFDDIGLQLVFTQNSQIILLRTGGDISQQQHGCISIVQHGDSRRNMLIVTGKYVHRQLKHFAAGERHGNQEIVECCSI